MLLKEQIEKYMPFDEQEEQDKEQILNFINNYDDVLTRNNIIGHFSGSAFVVNKQRTKMLVVYHNIFDGWIYPGGHADGNEDLLSTAVREVEEETGLKVKILDNDIYSIQSVAIKGHIKNGKYVSPHLHFDVLYIMEADDSIPLVYREDESKGVKWIPLEEADSDIICDFIRPIHRKLIRKLKNFKLKEYIKNNIFPLYDNNYIGDGLDRIKYVIDRSKNVIKENNLKVKNDILYTAICYHDIRKNSDEKEHEIISADIMFNDDFLKSYFSLEERTIIKEAIEDQRANLNKEPRNIYGRILSSASRNSSIEQCFKRSYIYGKKKNPNFSDEEVYENAYKVLLSKFGENGYAKFYYKDSVYEKFLIDIRILLSNKDLFIKAQKEYINILKEKGEL